MKIKEKVLKEVFDEFFDRDILEDAYVNSYLDEQIGNGLKKTIDLTLAEVGKVIDEGCGYLGSKFHICGQMFWFCDRCRKLKQKLRIEVLK